MHRQILADEREVFAISPKKFGDPTILAMKANNNKYLITIRKVSWPTMSRDKSYDSGENES